LRAGRFAFSVLPSYNKKLEDIKDEYTENRIGSNELSS